MDGRGRGQGRGQGRPQGGFQGGSQGGRGGHPGDAGHVSGNGGRGRGRGRGRIFTDPAVPAVGRSARGAGYRDGEDRQPSQYQQPSQHAQPREQYQQSREQYQQSREQYQRPREQYQQSRDQYQQSRDQYQQSRDQYQKPRDQYQQPRDQYQQPREQYQPRDQYQQPRDQYQQSQRQHQQPQRQHQRQQYQQSREQYQPRGHQKDGRDLNWTLANENSVWAEVQPGTDDFQIQLRSSSNITIPRDEGLPQPPSAESWCQIFRPRPESTLRAITGASLIVASASTSATTSGVVSGTPSTGASGTPFSPSYGAPSTGESGVPSTYLTTPSTASVSSSTGAVTRIGRGVTGQSQGRATLHRDLPQTMIEVSAERARGAVRARRAVTDFIKTRPATCATKSGTAGTPVELITNYFKILKRPQWSVYQYFVEIIPEEENVRERKAHIRRNSKLLPGFIYDGSILFTTKLLEERQCSIIYKPNSSNTPVHIKMRLVHEIMATDMQITQVINLAVRQCLAGLGLEMIGRNYYEPRDRASLDQLDIWPGFTTSCRQHEVDIMLCVEVASKVMRKESLLKILIDVKKSNPRGFQDDFRRQVCGSVVLTAYNNKTYRVDDVDFDQTPMSTFTLKDGTVVTYKQYYSERHRINIADLHQPLLISVPTIKNIRSGQNDYIMLVPELCLATGLTDQLKTNQTLMRQISNHTRLPPGPRMDRLKRFERRINTTQQCTDVLDSWDLEFDSDLVRVRGRHLPYQVIRVDSDNYHCDTRCDWTALFRNNGMYTQREIKHWIMLVPPSSVQNAKSFVRNILQVCQGMKMKVKDPILYEYDDGTHASVGAAINKAYKQDPQLLLIVVSSDNAERYGCIKKKCILELAVPSQVIHAKTITPRVGKSAGLLSIATKLMIQINTKLVGAPWMIKIPIAGLMTVGFDVCHSARETGKSFGAIVATMDLQKCCQYFSAVYEHGKGDDISGEISFLILRALKAYQIQHNALPSRILFYRDGVGDGQLQHVFENEVRHIRDKINVAYKEAGYTSKASICFIVVSKRINTRFFNGTENPLPGTVVDSVVTLPERYDFFLVSQSVRQGTVSPTNYNIIYDTSGLSPDQIQALTFKQTHLYYNWTGTCRVPAVCQYAHKLAFLVSQYLRTAPGSVFSDHLYFL